MRIQDKGVLTKSKMFLHIPSEFARSALFSAPIIGHFYCKDAYQVDRTYFEAYFLIMLIDKGEMSIRFRNLEYTACPDDVVVLDCREPHSYGAESDNTEFRYFHFVGNSSTEFFNLLFNQYGCVMRPLHQANINAAFQAMFEMAQTDVINEHRTSLLIHSILNDLVELKYHAGDTNDVTIRKIISFLEHHYTENISVKEIAEQFNLSMYYFISMFRKHTSMSPYNYMMELRIRLAKQLLSSSPQSIEQIAYACGFSSSQLFIRAFKKLVNCTPSQFRNASIYPISKSE